MRGRLLVIAMVLSAAGALEVARLEACGDKFLMLPGKGFSFDEIYHARYPGSVLIYAPTGAPGPDVGKVQAMLTRAGHRVTVVSSSDTLGSTAAGIKADILVTPVAETRLAGSVATATATAPVVLPILAAGNKAERAGCGPYPCELKAKDSIEKFVVAVNAAMKERSKARKSVPGLSR